MPMRGVSARRRMKKNRICGSLVGKKEGNRMQCRDFREIADSYLSDELMIETNHDVLRHLESCADCRRELAARRELISKLRKGFQEVAKLQMRAEFAGILKSQLRETALRRWPSVVTRAAQMALAAS